MTTVAIVGNGPSLLKRGLGGEIDRHDRVIRFNHYEIPKYQADVGTKQDIWYKTPPVQARGRKWLHYEEMWMLWRDKSSPHWKSYQDTINYAGDKLWLVPHKYLVWARAMQGEGSKPTNGFLAILVALDRGWEPTIYGIDCGAKDGNKSAKYYRRGEAPWPHKGQPEAAAIINLVEQGKVGLPYDSICCREHVSH